MIVKDSVFLRLSRFGMLCFALLGVVSLAAAAQRTSPPTENTAEAVARPTHKEGVELPPGGVPRLRPRLTLTDYPVGREQALRRELIQALDQLRTQATADGRPVEVTRLTQRIEALQAEEGPYVPSYRGQNGKFLVAMVIGRTTGSVWGGSDGVYTDDSDLGTAAVHAGLLRQGQIGQVRIEILAGRDKYEACTKNGITTYSFGTWQGSYRFVPMMPVAPPANTPAVDTLVGFRQLAANANGAAVLLKVTVTGRLDGVVWGDGIYTDDSDVGTAAVHAGLLKSGQTGAVLVELLPGRDSYTGSEKNGVTTRDYHDWPNSFRFVARDAINAGGPGGKVGSDKPKPEPTRIAPSPYTSPSRVPATGAVRTPRIYADPGSPGEYRERPTRMFFIQTTGSCEGPVWGTDIYTDDSTLAAAAVHAGVLKNGETGIVKVTMLPGRSDYGGTTRNGVTSHDWGSFGGSFKVEKSNVPVNAN